MSLRGGRLGDRRGNLMNKLMRLLRRAFALLAMTLVFFAPRLHAKDEVILNEGKTLSGTITNENAEEVTIKLGVNMVLRVDKSKIKQIKYDSKKKAAPAIWSPPPSAKATGGKPPSAVPSPTPQKPAVKSNMPLPTLSNPDLKFDVRKEGVVWIEETLRKLPKGKGGGDALPIDWKWSWSGVSRTDGDNFRWKEAVVASTITSRGEVEMEHVQVYREAVDSFAQALNLMETKNEAILRKDSETLFKDTRTRASKRLQGLERRQAGRKTAIKK